MEEAQVRLLLINKLSLSHLSLSHPKGLSDRILHYPGEGNAHPTATARTIPVGTKRAPAQRCAQEKAESQGGGWRGKACRRTRALLKDKAACQGMGIGICSSPRYFKGLKSP